MKKLITAAVASAFAFLAMGAANAVELPSGTSLENLTAGEALDPTKNDSGTGSDSTYWFLAGDENAELLVSNYVAASYQPRPEQFTGDNNNYLKIDTNGRLYRSVGVNSQTLDSFPTAEIGDGIYLDTLVQFTAADDEFKADAIAAGDKIAIEYVEREEERDGDDKITVTAMTNFVVRAGYVVGSSIVATNYYLTFPGQAANAVQFDKTAWHRLTVRAISNVGNEYAPVGFVVYVDGTNLVYDTSVAAGDATYVDSLNSVVSTYLYNSETHALLPSLLRYGETGYDTLSAVAFNGNGCVDDISFTADKPGILPAEGMTVTIAWDDNVASYTVVAGETPLVDGEVVSGEGSTNLLLSAGITAITVTATYADGYEAGAWSASAGTLNNGVWTFENGATLTINSMFPTFDVGGVHYGSFAAALIAAVEAGTAQNPAIIKLLADTSETIAFSEGYIVLDLNGKTLYPGATARYVVANQGASLKIIDTATGGIVKSGSSGSVLIRGDAAFTTIDAGKYEGTIAITGLDEAQPEQVLVVNGGKFYDEDYEDDPSEAKFYLTPYVDAATHTITGPDENFYFTVSSSEEPPAPKSVEVPTAIEGLIYNKGEQTGVVADEGYTLTGNVGTNAGSYTAIATLQEGYAWVGGSTDPTNIVWYIGMKGVTPTIVMDPTSATFDSNKTKVGDYVTSVVAYDGEDLLTENLDYYVSGLTEEVTEAGEYKVWVIQKAWSEGQNYMITNSQYATLTITAGGSYPSYITGHDDYKSKYDTWAGTYGADTGSAYEAAFLLNIAPDAEDQTLKPTAITMEGGKVVITANQTLTSVNGKVYVKVATTLAGLSTAEWAEATLSEGKVQVTPESSDTAGFYKIKVDF